ncbi:MAG TPA: hypothetical protein VGH32_03835, partial [Pirellulales bacterium]
MDFGAYAGSGQYTVGHGGVMLDGADEIFAPLFDGAGVDIDGVEMRLDVAIRTGDVADFDAEEDVAAIVGPVNADFLGFVLGDAAGRAIDGSSSQIDGVDFDVFVFFLALVDGVAEEG